MLPFTMLWMQALMNRNGPDGILGNPKPMAAGRLRIWPWWLPHCSLTPALQLQVGLVDMLKEEYGIEPAGMLGHSAGEIPCGYADGCLTREQTILTAYHRGRAFTCACLAAFLDATMSEL